MNKFTAIVLAYMLSISSAFAAERLTADANSATASAQNIFAELIASDQKIKSANIRVIITIGSKELEANAGKSIRILSLKVDEKRGNFFAKVAAGNFDPFEVNGKFEKVRLVPMLTRRMQKDSVITASDLTYAPANEQMIKRGIITDENDLIGKSLVRATLEGHPLTAKSVTAEKMISKNSIVTATYKSDVMTIQNSAIALEDGREGEMIRLKNETTNRVIRGKVTGVNMVELVPLNQVAANLASN